MLVDATDLDLWAATRDAEGRLPQLIRRLVLATVSEVHQLDFRAGEGVVLPGWDGVLDTAGGEPFVPEGASRWELTTSDDLPGKAQGDYVKRLDDPLGAEPTDSVFIFVTAHRWRTKQDWVERKQEERRWREVRAYDADNLATWLEQAPAVHIWISRQLGKHPPDAIDLETFWDDWCGVTNPKLTVPLVISGRQAQAGKLLEWIARPPSLLSLQAETEEEAIAFLAAAINDLPPEDRDRLYARSAVIVGDEAWRQLSYSARPLILIPQLPNRQIVPSAVARGHHVLVPLARNHPTDQSTLELPPVDREAANAVLVEMGFAADRADALSSLAWRGLAILRRELATSPALMIPEWAKLPQARQILPAVLAGRWDESQDADQHVVSHLAGQAYEEIRESLIYYSGQPDAPIRRIGEKWHTVARGDSWSLLAGFLTNPELNRFREAVRRVLREGDPKFDLPPKQRYAAAIQGKVPVHSPDLKDGIAETVSLLGAFEGIEGGLNGPQWANRMVQEVLEGADWKLWASLTSQLPILAEASPADFMNAVERDLRGDSPVIARLFAEEEGLLQSSPSVGLLWALERLAWSAEHLPRASLLLARLEEVTRNAT